MTEGFGSEIKGLQLLKIVVLCTHLGGYLHLLNGFIQNSSVLCGQNMGAKVVCAPLYKCVQVH